MGSMLLLLAAIVATLTSGCGFGDDDGGEQWSVANVIGDRTVRIISVVGHCAGRPEPKLRVEQIEYRGNGAYILAQLDKTVKPGDENKLCSGLELFVYKKVRLKRDIDQLVLYDASLDPPEQRWPIK